MSIFGEFTSRFSVVSDIVMYKWGKHTHHMQGSLFFFLKLVTNIGSVSEIKHAPACLRFV